MTAPEDWRAMREWLIKALADAKRLAANPHADLHVRIGFEAQVEVLSSALDFMDSRERAATTAPAEPQSALTLTAVQDQASRYLLARYGPNVAYRAPETFSNLIERWIWALGAGSAPMTEECIRAIEDHAAAAQDDAS